MTGHQRGAGDWPGLAADLGPSAPPGKQTQAACAHRPRPLHQSEDTLTKTLAALGRVRFPGQKMSAHQRHGAGQTENVYAGWARVLARTKATNVGTTLRNGRFSSAPVPWRHEEPNREASAMCNDYGNHVPYSAYLK